MARESRRIEFPGSQGENLAAKLELPAGAPKATALFAHCFTCSKDIFAAARLSEALAEKGFAVLRFDFTGLGASGGDFANTNFTSNVQDLVKAAEYMAAEMGGPDLLVGHSLGGAAILAAATELDQVKAVATIGAPADPAHVSHLFADSIEEIEAKGAAEVKLAGRPFRIQKQFLDDIANQAQAGKIATLKKALLVMHAPLDDYVSIDNATQIFVAAKHPKSFVSLDDADHLLTKRAHAIYAGEVLAAWASRYVGALETEQAAATEPKPTQPNEVIVSENGEGRFGQDMIVGPHRLRADEPAGVGGLDNGPAPYDLLNMALGACTAMTVRLYADCKGVPLDRVSVRLNHGKVHAADCAACIEEGFHEKARVDVIDRVLIFEGDLSAAQRAKLTEIADKCPVHKSLHAGVVVRTEVAE